MAENKITGVRLDEEDHQLLEVIFKKTKSLRLNRSAAIRWAIYHLAKSLSDPEYVLDPVSGRRLNRKDHRKDYRKAE